MARRRITKKAKASSESQSWKNLMVENVNDAQQELSYCIDLISHDIGKYMKQASKALEEQVVREAKFYGALMRLQRNWKVKREKLICAGPGRNAGFAIDLSDHVSFDLPFQTSKLSAVGVDQDKSGMLSVNQVGGTKLVLNFGFQGGQFGHKLWEKIKVKMRSDEKFQKEGVAVNQDTEKWLEMAFLSMLTKVLSRHIQFCEKCIVQHLMKRYFLWFNRKR